MRIDDLTADEFTASMALLGEAIENISRSGIGAELVADIRNGAGKQEGENAAIDWAMGIVSTYLPKLLKESVEDAYRILAACDGQTLSEYKAAFSPKKLATDLHEFVDAIKEGGELRELVTAFLS